MALDPLAEVAPVVVDLTIRAGATFRRALDLGDDADLTGCEARMQVRTRAGAEDTVIDISETLSDDGQITIGPLGSIVLWMKPDATDRLDGKRYAYDLFLEWPSGDVWKLMKGAVIPDPNVTEPTHD